MIIALGIRGQVIEVRALRRVSSSLTLTHPGEGRHAITPSPLPPLRHFFALSLLFRNAGRIGIARCELAKVGPHVHVIVMENAAHHLDLYFAHPQDPDEVIEARVREMDLVEEWVRQGYEGAVVERSGAAPRGQAISLYE